MRSPITPPRACRLATCAALVHLFPLALIGAAAEPPYGVARQSDVMVPMRDGVRLATDVYLPTSDGQSSTERLPTILMRTPYNKGGAAQGHPEAQYFAGHGYAVVFQDTRGRYKSEGVWHWMSDDGRDGFDTAEWIARQPWSNGKIGMIGTSYVGGTQHALAMAKSPHLATLIPVDAVCNQGYASMRNGGAFELRFWNWIMLNAGRGSRQSRDPAVAAMFREMADNVEVTGEIVVKLWVSSSAVDTDFAAKLIDVYPPNPDYPGGFDLNIGDGICRARFRDSLREEKLLRPGEVYPLAIKLYPTSNVFKRGNRIRVDISSSNFPRFDVNPNTGEPLNDHRRTMVATNTVHHDRQHPSHIVLPVIAAADK